MAEIRNALTKASQFEQIDTHTHIRGLGLDENPKAVKVKDGIVVKVFWNFKVYMKSDIGRQSAHRTLRKQASAEETVVKIGNQRLDKTLGRTRV